MVSHVWSSKVYPAESLSEGYRHASVGFTMRTSIEETVYVLGGGTFCILTVCLLKWSTYQHKASQCFGGGGALIYLYFPVCEWFYFLPNLGHLKRFKCGQNYQMWALTHLFLATRFMMFPRWVKWFSRSRPFSHNIPFLSYL